MDEVGKLLKKETEISSYITITKGFWPTRSSRCRSCQAKLIIYTYIYIHIEYIHIEYIHKYTHIYTQTYVAGRLILALGPFQELPLIRPGHQWVLQPQVLPCFARRGGPVGMGKVLVNLWDIYESLSYHRVQSKFSINTCFWSMSTIERVGQTPTSMVYTQVILAQLFWFSSNLIKKDSKNPLVFFAPLQQHPAT